MKKINYLFLVLLVSIQFATAQKTIHNYAYVVIPEQFSFQKTPGQYQLNELLQFLFDKEGVTTFLDNEKIPQELKVLDCGGLKMKANKESSMFKTKLSFTLSDCNNEIVFTSKEGVSREKDYKKGYHESMREAFKSFSEVDYSYVPVAVTASSVVKKENVIVSKNQTYTNDAKLEIELTPSEKGYMGHVKTNPTTDYISGDLICKLVKTSLPNIFKVQWKDTNGSFINTTGYFDETGNLLIDFSGDDGVVVMTFFK